LWMKAKGVNALDFSPDGDYLAVGEANKMVTIWCFKEET